MMEFGADSVQDVKLCFVSTFRLNVPFRTGSDSDSSLLGAYGDWKADVVSKLKEHGSGSFSWSEPNKSTSGQQNFAAGCFLEGSVKDLGSFADILKELDVFAGLSPKVTLLKIRLWEFGFGSIKVEASLKLPESNGRIKIKEKDIIAEMEEKKLKGRKSEKNFYEKLESIIESDIICQLESANESHSSSQSFAEKVRQYKGKKIMQQIGKLSESRVLFEFDVKDSKFSVQSNLLSMSLYDVCTEKNLLAENFSIFCSEDRDIIVFLRVGDDDFSKNITERILVQFSFLKYASAVGEMYEIFSASNLRYLNRIKSLSPIKINKLYFRGRESIIVEERRMVNSIYEEIQYISTAMSKSNYEINSQLISNMNLKIAKIMNCLSSFFDLVSQQNIAEKKYNSIEDQYKKIDKIASDEASTGQARAYNLASVLVFLFIFFFRGYYDNINNYDNITRDAIVPLSFLFIILLYVSRSFISYAAAWTSVKIEIYKHKKSKNSAALRDDQLWILMKQKSKWDCLIYCICKLTNRILNLFMHVVWFIDWMFRIIVIIAVLYLLIIGNPQTPNPGDPETPSNPPTTIDTSSPPQIDCPAPSTSTTTSTTLTTTTILPPEMQSTPPEMKLIRCPKRSFQQK